MKIMVLAMGRSGHHAIIQWIANGLDGIVICENNCKNGWNDKLLEPNKTKFLGDVANPDAIEHTIKNIEDFYLPLWNDLGMQEWEEFDKIITVVRSPLNWLASSIAAGGWARDYLTVAPKNEPELPVSRIEAYKEYFEPVLSCGCQTLNYDIWLESDSYRNIVARILGIKDTGIPNHCKFSSFGKNHDYNGDRYQLLNKEQKELFDSVYNDELKRIQKGMFCRK